MRTNASHQVICSLWSPRWHPRWGRCPEHVRTGGRTKTPPPGAQPDRPCRCRLSLKSPITQLDQGQLPRCICRVHTQPTRTHLAANASLETVSFVRFPFSLQWPLPFGPLGPGPAAHGQAGTPIPCRAAPWPADAVVWIVHRTPPGACSHRGGCQGCPWRCALPASTGRPCSSPQGNP